MNQYVFTCVLENYFTFQDGRDFMYGGDQGRYSMETLSTANGIKTVLVISQVVKEDAGLYSCDLSNPFGTDKHTIKVVVRGKNRAFILKTRTCRHACK